MNQGREVKPDEIIGWRRLLSDSSDEMQGG